MALNQNFRIVDVVRDVEDTGYYRLPAILNSAAKCILREFWIFIVILTISVSTGFFITVYGSSRFNRKSSIKSLENEISTTLKKWQSLSPEQKRELRKKLK